jgi:hypothetical protein
MRGALDWAGLARISVEPVPADRTPEAHVAQSHPPAGGFASAARGDVQIRALDLVDLRSQLGG